jgi:hypothetical protein
MNQVSPLTQFSSICAKFSKWSELKGWLTSAEGGTLRIVEADGETRYVIVRYDAKSDKKLPHVPFFRSVVWDTVTNRPVCVAPSMSQTGLPPADVSVRVTDFVDGVMVNAFRDADGLLRIATRTSLGAKTGFYSKKSFADMFQEASVAVSEDAGWVLESLEANSFLSFVLQHPDHRIVQPVTDASLHLVLVGSVGADGSVNMSYNSLDFPTRLAPLAPTVYGDTRTFATAADAVAEVERQAQHESTGWQGIVFQEANGPLRWRHRSSDYVLRRGLRGGEATAAQRYARLRLTKQVKAYLKVYGEDSAAFMESEAQLRKTTMELFDYYTNLFKLKKVGWKEVPVGLRGHLYALHGLYSRELRAKKQTVTREVVIDYVNRLQAEQACGLMRVHVAPPLAAAPAAPAAAGEGATAPFIAEVDTIVASPI